MKRSWDQTSAKSEIEAEYLAFLRAIDVEDPTDLEGRARRLESHLAAHDPDAEDAATQVRRTRVAVILAAVLPIWGVDTEERGRFALKLAKALCGDTRVAAGCAEGLVAEAYLALCKQARSTAKRALFFHQGRAAAKRALSRNPDDLSANFAMGSFHLNTPVAFGGSAERSIPYFERVLAHQPEHRGAQVLSTAAYFRSGRRGAFEASLLELRRNSPRLTSFLLTELIPEATRSKRGASDA